MGAGAFLFCTNYQKQFTSICSHCLALFLLGCEPHSPQQLCVFIDSCHAPYTTTSRAPSSPTISRGDSNKLMRLVLPLRGLRHTVSKSGETVM